MNLVLSWLPSLFLVIELGAREGALFYESMNLQHYKDIILERIQCDVDPNDRHIREWTAEWIQVNRLLKQMQREGLISIEYFNDRGCVRRLLKKK